MCFETILKFNNFCIGERKDDDVQSSTSHGLMERLGYKIGAKIGFGSYSTVRVRARTFMCSISQRYRTPTEFSRLKVNKFQMGYSNDHKQLVALKIIWKDRASKLFQKRFLPREITIARALRHPNIVQYLQYIETNRR